MSITTIAGVVGEAGYARDGGPATSGLLNGPLGLAFDAAGVLYVADYSNNVVRALR